MNPVEFSKEIKNITPEALMAVFDGEDDDLTVGQRIIIFNTVIRACEGVVLMLSALPPEEAESE